MSSTSKTNRYLFLFLSLFLIVLVLANLAIGSVSIPLDVFVHFFDNQTAESEKIWHHIIIESRLPQTITAILAGSALGLAGLQMQTLFRNPLAGPSILGISSGASLGVALLTMGSGFGSLFLNSSVLQEIGVHLAAFAGSFSILFVILFAAKKIEKSIA